MKRIAYKTGSVTLRMAVSGLMPIFDADFIFSGPFGNKETGSIFAVI
jgi:hypothetical protein